MANKELLPLAPVVALLDRAGANRAEVNGCQIAAEGVIGDVQATSNAAQNARDIALISADRVRRVKHCQLSAGWQFRETNAANRRGQAIIFGIALIVQVIASWCFVIANLRRSQLSRTHLCSLVAIKHQQMNHDRRKPSRTAYLVRSLAAINMQNVGRRHPFVVIDVGRLYRCPEKAWYFVGWLLPKVVGNGPTLRIDLDALNDCVAAVGSFAV